MNFLRPWVISGILLLHCLPLFAGDKEQLAALKAAPDFVQYFRKANERLLERDYVLELCKLALISKEHMILLGPPGNAKSMLADTVLGGLLDPESKDSSYFKIQMTPETSLSETVGPFNYGTLVKDNEYVRMYESGMLLSRVAFIDEIFDGRANAMRDILTLLNERQHAQGRKVTQGKIETVIAASNTYISQVYEKFGNDQPKALLDRFSFTAFVPQGFKSMSSYLTLMQNSKVKKGDIPPLTFMQLDAIRKVTKDVKLTPAMSSLIHILVRDVQAELSALEQTSLKAFEERKRLGETAKPPYRSTKYFSIRTLKKATKTLRTIAVLDWLEKSVSNPDRLRKLEVNLQDIKKLELFFTLNGPDSEFVERELSKSTDPNERAQLDAILKEREVFRRHFQKLVTDWNEIILSDFMVNVEDRFKSARSDLETKQIAYEVWLEMKALEKRRTNTDNPDTLTTEQIALEEASAFLSRLLMDTLRSQYPETMVAFEKKRSDELAQKRAEEEKRARFRSVSESTSSSRNHKIPTAEELHRDYTDDRNAFKITLGEGLSASSFFQASVPGSSDILLLNEETKRMMILVPLSNPRAFKVGSEVNLDWGNDSVTHFVSLDSKTVAVQTDSNFTLFSIKDGYLIKSINIPSRGYSTYHFLYGAEPSGHCHLKYVDTKEKIVNSFCVESGRLDRANVNTSLGFRTPTEIFDEMVQDSELYYFNPADGSFTFTSSGMKKVYRLKNNELSYLGDLPERITQAGAVFSHSDESGNLFSYTYDSDSSSNKLKIFKIEASQLEKGTRSQVYKAKVDVSKERGFTVVNGNVAIIPNRKSGFTFLTLHDSTIIGVGDLSDERAKPMYPRNLEKDRIGYFVVVRKQDGTKVLEYILKIKG